MPYGFLLKDGTLGNFGFLEHWWHTDVCWVSFCRRYAAAVYGFLEGIGTLDIDGFLHLCGYRELSEHRDLGDVGLEPFFLGFEVVGVDFIALKIEAHVIGSDAATAASKVGV